MKRRSISIALCLFALSLMLTGFPPASADPKFMETTGIVTAFDDRIGFMNVNTRFGPMEFVVFPSTLILLNNRLADVRDLRAGDRIIFTFRLDTREIGRIEITREARVRGKILSVTNTNINFRLREGGLVSFRRDAFSVFRLEGMKLRDPSVLAGRQATIIFEPGTLLLLSVAAHASRAEGRVATVDASNRKLTLAGRRRPFTVHPDATITRNGETVMLNALQPRDRVEVLFVRRRHASEVLLIKARGKRVDP